MDRNRGREEEEYLLEGKTLISTGGVGVSNSTSCCYEYEVCII